MNSHASKASVSMLSLVRTLSLAVLAGLAAYTLIVVFILEDYSVSILLLIATHALLFSSTLALTYRNQPDAADRARFIFVTSCMTLITLLSLMWEKDTGLQQLLLVGMITSGFIFPRSEQQQRRFAEYTYGLLYIIVEGVIVFSETHTWATLRLSNAIILVSGGLVMLRLVRDKIEKQAEALLLSERRNTTLLKSMLPAAPDDKSKHWPLGHTEKITNVSVLFADLQGYTKLSEKYDDIGIVAILDDLYRLFDAHALRLGIEKVKTNGDEYMAATGIPSTITVPEYIQENTAVTLCTFASAILESFHELAKEKDLGCNIRIGIATGSVTGGIIGAHKPHFDIWGKTVNRAARLEQASQPGTITVCARTRGQLVDAGASQFEFSNSFVVGDNLVAHSLLLQKD